MATYKILTTPGREEVDLQGWLKDQAPQALDNQDKVRMVLSALRAIERKNANKEDRPPRDFVAVKVSPGGSNGTSTSAATSIRLSEEVRRELAKVCGAIMAETGDPISMGDAVLHLVNFYRGNKDLVDRVKARRAQKAAS